MADFAVPTDVEARLGRELTSEETVQVTVVIETVSGLIVDAVDKDSAWAAALDPVSPVLKALCVEKALKSLRTTANPVGVGSETLGAHSVTYLRSQEEPDIFLTDREERMARMAVYGTLSGSSSPRGLPDRLIDLAEDRDVDEIEV